MDIVLIDDGSTDGTTEAVHSQFPDTIVLQGDGNLWWTGAINKGVEYALAHNYDAVLLLNDDLKLADDLFVELFKVSDLNPNALVSAIKLLEKDGSAEIITAGFSVKGILKNIYNNNQDDSYNSINLDKILDCDILTGATLLIPSIVFQKIGLFNENKFPHNWGDFEFTWRASLHGFSCLLAPRARIYTEYNKNYHKFYYLNSSKIDYIKNLFDYKRYNYGFRFLYNRSFMHRPKWAASILYVRGMFSLLKKLIIKVVLPQNIFILVMKKK